MTMQENIVETLKNVSQILYGSNIDIFKLINGDLLKVMNLASILHYAVDFERNEVEEALKFSLDEDQALWVKDNGWNYLGVMAPSTKAIVKAVEIISNHNHPMRKYFHTWEMEDLLKVDLI